MDEERLSAGAIRAAVDVVDEQGENGRLCLTVDGRLCLLNPLRSTVVRSFPSRLVLQHSERDGERLLTIGGEVLRLAKHCSPAKVDFFFRCIESREDSMEDEPQPAPARQARGPGWYPDPAGVFELRYFNASGQWERHCRDADGRAVRDGVTDPLALEPPFLQATGETPSPAPRPRRLQGLRPPVTEAFEPGAVVHGTNGTVRVDERFVIIERGLGIDLALGNLRGTKSIPLRSVQAVQLKRATRLVEGALEFVVAGDRSNTGMDRFRTGNAFVDTLFGRQFARSAHENIVTFNIEQQQPFLDLHEYLLGVIDAGQNAHAVARPLRNDETTSDGLVHQLERLSDLHRAGVLSDEEFAAAKLRLLG